MFPSSAHINDTLVSIVTKGERRGKGVLHWAKGIQPKAATQGEWKEGSAFPTAGLSIHCGLCLPSGLSPRTLHIQMQWCAEQKSYQGPRGWGSHGGGTGAGYPLSSSTVCSLVKATGGRGGTGREERGLYKYFVFTNGSFQTLHFPGSAHLPREPLGGSTGLTGKTKAVTATVVSVSLAEKQCGHLQRLPSEQSKRLCLLAGAWEGSLEQVLQLVIRD